MADNDTSDPDGGASPSPVVEPRLPFKVPAYDGRTPSAVRSRLTGTANRLGPHLLGETVVAVVELHVSQAGHQETDDEGLAYVIAASLEDLFEVSGVAGARLLAAVRAADRIAADAATGRAPLEGMATAGVTDGSGVVLTPEELAAVRGEAAPDLVREMTGTFPNSPDPVVVVFEGGGRDLWPDDYEKDEPRPTVGAEFDDGSGGLSTVVVVELLDAETGETLARLDPEGPEASTAGPTGPTVADDDEAATLTPAADDDDEEASQAAEEAADLEPFAAGDDYETGEAYADGIPPLPGEDEEGLEPLDPEEVVPVAADPFDAGPDLTPTADDFEVVDRSVADLRAVLADLRPSPARLAQLLEAEKRGRGRGLKTRAGAVDLIQGLLAEAAAPGPVLREFDEEGPEGTPPAPGSSSSNAPALPAVVTAVDAIAAAAGREGPLDPFDGEAVDAAFDTIEADADDLDAILLDHYNVWFQWFTARERD